MEDCESSRDASVDPVLLCLQHAPGIAAEPCANPHPGAWNPVPVLKLPGCPTGRAWDPCEIATRSA